MCTSSADSGGISEKQAQTGTQRHETKGQKENRIMSKIVNKPKIKNKFIVKIRELLEHRAFWLYLAVDFYKELLWNYQ